MLFDSMYPAILIVTVLMLAGGVISRRSRFYGQLVARRGAARYESLDGLRGFLAVGVIVHHGMSTHTFLTTGRWEIGQNLPLYPVYQLLGTSSVAMFFMITGFLFWGKILEHDGRLDVRDHIRGRLTRLAPIYLVMATIASVISLYFVWSMSAPRSHLIGMFFTIYAMGIPNWMPVHQFNPSGIVAGVTWTLRYEWFFYALLPVMAAFRKPRWLVVMGLGYLAYFVFTTHDWAAKPLGPSMNLLGGMICAQLRHAGVMSRFNFRSRWTSAAALLTIAMLPVALGLRMPLLLFPLTLGGFWLIASGNTLFGLLTAAGPKTVGTMSYSFYLLHGIVLYLGHSLLAHLIAPGLTPLYWIAIVAMGLVAVTISALTYRWIEHPFIEMERERRKAGVPAEQLLPIYAWPNHIPPRRLAA